MSQRVIISTNLESEIAEALAECEHDKIFVLTDETTVVKCWPVVKNYFSLRDAKVITIGATDTHKDLDTMVHVWKSLGEGGASRHSCMINLGGGMVTDLGGFAAATFKRGINFINTPTTLLSMVDASVGGKTGINFNGFKNEVGVFQESHAVIIDTDFLRTLDDENLRSGYAEMLKHSLLENEAMWADHLRFDLTTPNYAHLQELVAQSIRCKERIVTEDPHEHGIRKALNLGHTVGHAFESLALERHKPILHGYAVAYGLLCELYLSAAHTGFPTEKMRQTVAFIRENYGPFAFDCKDYEHIYNTMLHDKKNVGGVINFTLLSDIGGILLNQHLSKEEVFESFDFFREG